MGVPLAAGFAVAALPPLGEPAAREGIVDRAGEPASAADTPATNTVTPASTPPRSTSRLPISSADRGVGVRPAWARRARRAASATPRKYATHATA